MLFALTEHEMNKVYDSVQHHWDKEDIINWLDCNDLLEYYSDDQIDELAWMKRAIESGEGVNWWDAVENAVLEFNSTKKGGNAE